MSEDARTAATIKTTLSGSLIAAAFGVGAVQAALVVFVLDKKLNLTGFTVVAILASLALVASAALGAKGIATVYRPGYSGTWEDTAGKPLFSGQALTGFAGLLLVIWSAFLGDPKPNAPTEPPGYSELRDEVRKLRTELTALQAARTPTVGTPQPQQQPKSRIRNRRPSRRR
jgi:hypothetical protein